MLPAPRRPRTQAERRPVSGGYGVDVVAGLEMASMHMFRQGVNRDAGIHIGKTRFSRVAAIRGDAKYVAVGSVPSALRTPHA
jgi:hypothetical protein